MFNFTNIFSGVLQRENFFPIDPPAHYTATVETNVYNYMTDRKNNCENNKALENNVKF